MTSSSRIEPELWREGGRGRGRERERKSERGKERERRRERIVDNRQTKQHAYKAFIVNPQSNIR